MDEFTERMHNKSQKASAQRGPYGFYCVLALGIRRILLEPFRMIWYSNEGVHE